MSAKDFLRQARKLQERIDQLEEACSRVQSGSSAQLSAQIERERDRLNGVRAEILAVVSQITDNTLATLLIAYYINGKTWEDVAEELHYSYRHVVRALHPRALSSVEKILEKMS